MLSRKLLTLVLFGIFGFWLLITKDNYFHWDEWGFFTSFKKGYFFTLFGWGNEHFIPINILHHYVIFKIFGLNYLPYQVSVLIFHTLNCFLLFKIVLLRVNKRWLAIICTILFGFTSVFIENIVWSLGVSVILACTFFFTSYYFFLKLQRNFKYQWLILSAILLIASPLQHGITILAPMAFILSTIMSPLKLKTKQFVVLIYLGVMICNIAILLSFNNHRTFSNVGSGWTFMLTNIPLFIFSGITIGTISRELFPALYFYGSGLVYPAYQLRPLVVPTVIITISLIIFQLLFRSKHRKKNLLLFINYLPFILITYLAIAPARASFGLSQSIITRYTTSSLFFILLLLAELISLNNINKKVIIIISCCLLTLHLIADINFQRNHWYPLVNRDKKFISDLSLLHTRNEKIYDLPVEGIYPKTSVSNYWFTIPNNKIIVYGRDKNVDKERVISSSDSISAKIYRRIIENYSQKAD